MNEIKPKDYAILAGLVSVGCLGLVLFHLAMAAVLGTLLWWFTGGSWFVSAVVGWIFGRLILSTIEVVQAYSPNRCTECRRAITAKNDMKCKACGGPATLRDATD